MPFPCLELLGRLISEPDLNASFDRSLDATPSSPHASASGCDSLYGNDARFDISFDFQALPLRARN